MSFTAVDALTDQRAVVMVPLEQLVPHPENPRRDVGDLTDLAADVKARGVDSPLTVVPLVYDGYPEVPAETFRVVIGHRRLAAAIVAGLPRVPCIVRDLSPAQQRAMMVRENVHRADLSPVEEADAYQAMLTLDGLTIEQVAETVARSASTVRRRARLASAPEPARSAIHTGQATLDDWDKALTTADGDPEALTALAEALGSRDFGFECQRVQRNREAAAGAAAVAAFIAEHALTRVHNRDVARSAYRPLGDVETRGGKIVKAPAAEIPEGSLAGSWSDLDGPWTWCTVWAPAVETAAGNPPAPATDNVEARPAKADEMWAAQAAARQAEHAARREEFETATEVRRAWVRAKVTGAPMTTAHLAAVARGAAELYALAGIHEWPLGPDEPDGVADWLGMEEDIDTAHGAAVDEDDEDQDPDDVDLAEVLTAALPARLDVLSPGNALLAVLAAGVEAARLYGAVEWARGYAADPHVQAYYRLLGTLGYVPSTPEAEALNRPVPAVDGQVAA